MFPLLCIQYVRCTPESIWVPFRFPFTIGTGSDHVPVPFYTARATEHAPRGSRRGGPAAAVDTEEVDDGGWANHSRHCWANRHESGRSPLPRGASTASSARNNARRRAAPRCRGCTLTFETKSVKSTYFQRAETRRVQHGVNLMSACTALPRGARRRRRGRPSSARYAAGSARDGGAERARQLGGARCGAAPMPGA